jgi:hypothetical protein
MAEQVRVMRELLDRGYGKATTILANDDAAALQLIFVGTMQRRHQQ